MTQKVTLRREYPVRYLKANMNVRYWEDAELNGETDIHEQMPLRQGDMWVVTVNIETGKVLDWPKGTTAKTHYKVCDAGIYALYQTYEDLLMNKPLETYNDIYVPTCLSNGGWGDYVILSIDKNGFIENWKFSPLDFSCDE